MLIIYLTKFIPNMLIYELKVQPAFSTCLNFFDSIISQNLHGMVSQNRISYEDGPFLIFIWFF